MKNTLILSFSNLKTDPRVRRQIEALSSSFKVTCAGFNDPEMEGVQFIPLLTRSLGSLEKTLLSARLKLGLFEAAYWSLPQVQLALQAVSSLDKFDLIIANDIITLPIALKIKNKAPVMFDAHEYAPREFEDVPKWRFFWQKFYIFLCRKYLPQTNSMTTVCSGIADEYEKNFGVISSIIINSPLFHKLDPKPVDPRLIRIIHHGGAMPSRKIETMIEMADFLDDRFHLDLMLVPSDLTYYKTLVELADKKKNVSIIPPIATERLSEFCNSYDIGLFLLPPVNFNYKFALPNKFFEYIQSRLMIAIGPSPEMKKIVESYKNGVVSEDFSPEKLAKEINKLSPQEIFKMKMNSDKAAQYLNFESSRVELQSIAAKLTNYKEELTSHER